MFHSSLSSRTPNLSEIKIANLARVLRKVMRDDLVPLPSSSMRSTLYNMVNIIINH